MDSLGNTKEPSPASVPGPGTTINDLPTETLLDIFSYLSPIELKDLRLVCRKWNHAVSDKASWIRAFRNRFGTGQVFASVTGSEKWIPEYFGRVGTLKKWAKAKATAKLYMLVNSEFAQLDHVQADFIHDRLMTYCLYTGTVAMCSLTLGKNQVFIPESSLFSRFTCFDANWNYLCVGKDTGEIHLRNLMTATATSSNRLSVTTISEASGRRVTGVKINSEFDKHKEKPDLLSVDINGLLLFWNLSGKLLHLVGLDDNVFWIDSDFKTSVVAVSKTQVYVVDFASRQLKIKHSHGFDLSERPVAMHVDFGDDNVVICDAQHARVFHFYEEGQETKHFVSEAKAPQGEQIIGGTLQQLNHEDKRRNVDVAGGDGRLYGLTFSDGSVATFNLRETSSEIVYNTRIMPFTDDRSYVGVPRFTKIALNSAVVAIGASPNWIHIYDAHSGEYLRECLTVSKKLTRDGLPPILSIRFAPNQQAGVVVSGDIVQYFKFGEAALASKKKPNVPQVSEANTKRARQQHIKAQVEEYERQEHHRKEASFIADKYNGTEFDSEQEELRMAMALSVSSAPQDDEFERALALSQQEAERQEAERRNNDYYDEDLEAVLAMTEPQSSEASSWTEPTEGSLRSLESTVRSVESTDDDEEILRKVMELLLLEH